MMIPYPRIAIQPDSEDDDEKLKNHGRSPSYINAKNSCGHQNDWKNRTKVC